MPGPVEIRPAFVVRQSALARRGVLRRSGREGGVGCSTRMQTDFLRRLPREIRPRSLPPSVTEWLTRSMGRCWPDSYEVTSPMTRLLHNSGAMHQETGNRAALEMPGLRARVHAGTAGAASQDLSARRHYRRRHPLQSRPHARRGGRETEITSRPYHRVIGSPPPHKPSAP
jgi:hypothetical protein